MRKPSASVMISGTPPALDVDPAVNMGRQALYRFTALSFLDPRSGSWEKLTALRTDRLLIEAAALIRGLQGARPAELARGERPFEMLDPSVVLDRLPDSPQALNAQYESTFGLLVSSNCPPYEMEYVNSKFTFQRSNTLADINGFYHAFGLTVPEGRPERPDHIVLELEFMACLLTLEREAAADGAAGAARRRQICRDAQCRFFETHLAWWLPTFAELVARQNVNGFYAAAGSFLAAFIAAEGALLGLPPVTGRVEPTTEERPELCEGCALAT
jgi:TorA maturation chaperone TorD